MRIGQKEGVGPSGLPLLVCSEGQIVRIVKQTTHGWVRAKIGDVEGEIMLKNLNLSPDNDSESASFDPLRSSTSRGTPRAFYRRSSMSQRWVTRSLWDCYLFDYFNFLVNIDGIFLFPNSPRSVHVEYFSDILLRPIGSYPFEDFYRKHFNAAHSENFQVPENSNTKNRWFSVYLKYICC